MLTRAAYKLADLIAQAALRLDRRYVGAPTNGDSFPIVGTSLAAACLLFVALRGTR